ncbi:MAG: enoyl-CoA hydratase-related protein [Propionibacteriaceae bacterium]|nr:enoyl-CoA hydratase-related protein [Propionibacteriaceae bacterium]
MALVRIDRESDVTTITLTDAATRNTLSQAMLTQLRCAIEDVGQTDTLVVVLAAEGPVFSAGHNLGELVGISAPDARRLFEAAAATMAALHAIPQPVIARVQGPAFAAGCQLVASADLAIAAASASFALPGITRGLFCHTPLVAVSRAIAPKRALEMALTGTPIDAETAAQWGLVNRCVPDDQLDAAVDELVHRLTDTGSPYARGLGKRVFYDQAGLPEAQAYALAAPAIALNAILPDAQEGFASFVAKRAPQFTMGPHD